MGEDCDTEQGLGRRRAGITIVDRTKDERSKAGKLRHNTIKEEEERKTERIKKVVIGLNL